MAFNGPWSADLDSFKTSLQSTPEKYKCSFLNASKATLEKICDPDVLHIWDSDTDIDNLLQLTSIIAKLCDLGGNKEKGANANGDSMLIIAEEKSGRDNFGRICQLVEYLTGTDGKKHIEGTVVAFGKIVVVRGWQNARHPAGTGNREAAEKVVKRINISIERVLQMSGMKSGKRKIVWHHSPVIHFLLHWINNTTSTLRSKISAITITGSLDLTDNIAPSNAGRANTVPDLQLLESYAKRMDVPVVFLDSPSQLITFEHLGNYMCFYAYYINTLLPSSLSRPHLHKAQDELVTFAFRLRAASENKYGSEAVKAVHKHLDASKAKYWARMCVNKESYEKAKCRAAGRDEAIHDAVLLADCPFALFNHGNRVLAFARLAVGPAAAGSVDCYTAAPVQINFHKGQMRPLNPAVFHILIPAKSQDLEKVTNRIQGLMMAVLERVRREKGNPQLGDAERGMWKAVVKACSWAMNESAGKMPKGVDDKIKFVKEKLREGTWGYALGAPTGSTKTGAASKGAALLEPNRTYGFGQGYGAAPTMGAFGYTGQPHQPSFTPQQVQGLGYPQQIPTQGQTQGIQVGQGQQNNDYPQSMGGPW
ncbi:hypothetical protein BKA66DRAFT_557711 [Pyrenochaeta sp. MPI-SDFR-AT-0127]|nr:hypothetical protein BKA66DRAFT_557711 [Pyrenochaeta sp. MPI-SDFR-AT-0127]